MAVKDAILAILTLGPAYGLQLRDELVSRAPHRDGLNVGQVYSTLDRLGKAGLISSDTSTEDNLPLYALTADGRSAVRRWLSLPTPPDVRYWHDMADQVLVASSLPGCDWRSIVAAQERSWATVPDAGGDDDSEVSVRVPLSRIAEREVAIAALGWLRIVDDRLASADPGVPLRRTRPQRGRRPGPLSRT